MIWGVTALSKSIVGPFASATICVEALIKSIIIKHLEEVTD